MTKIAKTYSTGWFTGKTTLQCPHCKRETVHLNDFLTRNGGLAITCGDIPNGNKAGCRSSFMIPGKQDPSCIRESKITHKGLGFLGLRGNETHLFCPYCNYQSILPGDFQENSGGQFMRCESCFDIYQIPLSQTKKQVIAQQRADEQAAAQRRAAEQAAAQRRAAEQAAAQQRAAEQAAAQQRVAEQAAAQQRAAEQAAAQRQSEAKAREQAELQRKAELKRQKELEWQKAERDRLEQERKYREREERMNIARRQESDQGFRPPWDN